MLYVILYLRRVLTHRIDVIPSAPELPVPVFEFQITKLLVKHQTAFPFQIYHKAGYAHFGRALHKHMDMIYTASVHFSTHTAFSKYCLLLYASLCRTPVFGILTSLGDYLDPELISRCFAESGTVTLRKRRLPLEMMV